MKKIFGAFMLIYLVLTSNSLFSASIIPSLQSKSSLSSGHLLSLKPKNASFSAYSFAVLIPYVTNANNTRTNVGINHLGMNSVVKGTAPTANLLLELYDQNGYVNKETTFTLTPNQLYQINDIFSSLQATINTGYVVIWSDEPIAAWASVIFNSTNDPSIETGVPLQLGKFDAYIDGFAIGADNYSNRLILLSSAKTGSWQSSLVVTNLAWWQEGDFRITIYDNSGKPVSTLTQHIPSGGQYVNDDIRSAVPGTYGQIVIEPLTNGLMLAACSIIKSATNTSSFFPAQSIPPTSNKNVAGIWAGNINSPTDGVITAKLTLFQEGAMLYGIAEFTYPGDPQSQAIAVSGEILGTAIQLDMHDMFDTSTGGLLQVGLRIIAGMKNGNMEGKYLSVDQDGIGEVGTFSLSRTGNTCSIFN